MTTRYVQQRTIVYQIFVNGEDRGLFTEGDGGGLSTEKVQYGDGPVAGGVTTREDLKLVRPYSEVDAELEAKFERDQINGAEVLALRSMAGDDGLPLGKPKKMTGVFIAGPAPESNKTANERGMFEISVALNTEASQ